MHSIYDENGDITEYGLAVQARFLALIDEVCAESRPATLNDLDRLFGQILGGIRGTRGVGTAEFGRQHTEEVTHVAIYDVAGMLTVEGCEAEETEGALLRRRITSLIGKGFALSDVTCMLHALLNGIEREAILSAHC